MTIGTMQIIGNVWMVGAILNTNVGMAWVMAAYGTILLIGSLFK